MKISLRLSFEDNLVPDDLAARISAFGPKIFAQLFNGEEVKMKDETSKGIIYIKARRYDPNVYATGQEAEKQRGHQQKLETLLEDSEVQPEKPKGGYIKL